MLMADCTHNLVVEMALVGAGTRLEDLEDCRHN